MKHEVGKDMTNIRAALYLKVGDEAYPFKYFTYSIRRGAPDDEALVVEWILENPLELLPEHVDEEGVSVHSKFNVEGGEGALDREMVLRECTLQVQHPRLLKGVAKKLSLEEVGQNE